MKHNMLHVGSSSVFELNWFPPTISAVSLHFRSIRGLVYTLGRLLFPPPQWSFCSLTAWGSFLFGSCT